MSRERAVQFAVAALMVACAVGVFLAGLTSRTVDGRLGGTAIALALAVGALVLAQDRAGT